MKLLVTSRANRSITARVAACESPASTPATPSGPTSAASSSAAPAALSCGQVKAPLSKGAGRPQTSDTHYRKWVRGTYQSDSQALIDSPALPGSFRQLSDEAPPRLSQQPGGPDMAQTRFTCTLTTADEPGCQSYARVTIADAQEPAPAHVLVTPSPRSMASAAPALTGSTPRASTTTNAGPSSWPRNAASSQLRDHQDQGAGAPGVKHGRELRMAISG